MEATRSRRKISRTNRNPFSDCTNTVDSLNPSQSSSTSTKNSSSPFNKPSNFLNSNTTKTSVAANPRKTSATRSSAGIGERNPSNPSAAVLVPSVSTPSRSQKQISIEDTTSPTVPDLSSVYGRRQSADKKRKGKEIAGSMSCFPAIKTCSNRNELKEVAVTSLSKSCTVPNKKKRHKSTAKEDDANHALLKDYIEQQRKYFAEIDAFELPEEEVTSIDELD